MKLGTETKRRSLNGIIAWGHELLAEVVVVGDLVVDLTAGRGQDTLALQQLVGVEGQVVAFDVQSEALTSTRMRLSASGIQVRHHDRESPLPRRPGVDLVQLCHTRYAQVVAEQPAAAIANLGYLPGGDQKLVTCSESTISALAQVLASLKVGGRLAVVVYPGHPGGQAEADQVACFFAGLGNIFDVLQLKLCNRYQAPGLFVAEKRRGA